LEVFESAALNPECDTNDQRPLAGRSFPSAIAGPAAAVSAQMDGRNAGGGSRGTGPGSIPLEHRNGLGTQDMRLQRAQLPTICPGSGPCADGLLYNFSVRQMIWRISAYQEKTLMIISSYGQQKN
jgi:hypothetical protein